MNYGIKHISTPQPCTQNWADMVMAEQGRFCQNCQKTVIDFTRLSNEQILNVLSSAGKVCGRFEDTQLKQLNAITAIETPVERFSWKKLGLAATFIGLVPFMKVEAKIKPPVEHQPILSKKLMISPADTIKQFRTITGSVKDTLGEALSGVTIKISGTQFNTTSDINGNFRLSIPVSTGLVARVSYIGFLNADFKIDQHVDNYLFVLRVAQSTMGEVIIVPVKKSKPIQKKQD